MIREEIEKLRHKLHSLRTELQHSEGSSKEATAEMDEAAVARLSRADAIHAQLIAEEPARLRNRQLGKIEGAFRRIEAGEYGNCFVCGGQIEIDRLSEDPTLTRCIKCVEI